MLRVLALLAAILASTAEVRPATPDLPFRVVVHRSSSVASLSRAELSAIFMRRASRWSPIDQPARSHVREQFSTAIHGKSVAYVIRYWQRLIFAGRAIPPAEGKNDAAVLAFVRSHADGIGYIDAATPIGDDMKVIVVTR